VSRDRNYLIYRNGKHLRVLKAGEKPDNGASGYTKKSGWIDLNRARVAVNPPTNGGKCIASLAFATGPLLDRKHGGGGLREIYKRYYALIDR